MKYVGLDVHKKNCHATVMNSGGEILDQQFFPNSPEDLESFFRDIENGKVTMEATYMWESIYDQLEGLGHEVVLAHPYKTRLIAEERIKTDCRDSEALAHLLRTDFLPEAYVPSQDLRELRELLRRRVSLVESATRYKNKIRAELSKRRIEIDGTPWTGIWRDQLEEVNVDAVGDYYEVLGALEEHVDKLNKEIREKVEESDEAKLLMTIPGVGYFSALTILASIGEIDRFSGPKKLSSYFGLVPSSYQSGDKTAKGSITKQGDRYVRRVLIQCAWSHVNHSNTYLTKFFKRLEGRKGSNTAIVATARKMTEAIYWMLKRREKFRPQG